MSVDGVGIEESLPSGGVEATSQRNESAMSVDSAEGEKHMSVDVMELEESLPSGCVEATSQRNESAMSVDSAEGEKHMHVDVMELERSSISGCVEATSQQDNLANEDFETLTFLGIKLPYLETHNSQLLFCAAGLIVFFTTQNFVQEYIFHIPGFKFGAFMASFEFIFCAVMSGYERTLVGEPIFGRSHPIQEYMVLAAVTAGSGVAGTSALGFVNMPVKVIMKSSKLVPTMFMGWLINAESYTCWEWGTSVLLCIAIAIFSLADASVSPKFSLIGIGLLSIAVCFDAAVPQCQQRLLRPTLTAESASKPELIFWSSSLGFLFVAITVIISGQSVDAILFCAVHPTLLLILVAYGMLTYLGVVFYITLVRNFGAVVTITLTTARKVVTLCVSIIVFDHAWTITHVVAGGCVLFLGTIKTTKSKKAAPVIQYGALPASAEAAQNTVKVHAVSAVDEDEDQYADDGLAKADIAVV